MLTSALKGAEEHDYLSEKFKKAYEFLRNEDLTALPLGRTDIDGDNVFANVQEYTTMPADTCKFEAHDDYYDIQYVVSGKEQFGYVKREGLVVDTPYDAANDLIFYKDPKESGSILLEAGDMAIVPPEDAHKPRCVAGEPVFVRKIVVKVRV